ncbi:MAG TPA: glycosyltransferase family 2 protein [Burkholderiales bacterium]|nr:glycosyltransferase family 2 protein [Burkholderiales bacterium]
MSDKPQPLVSVVTVVRNGMPFLVENLDSVAGQDYPALEHWIIDGGSTDGTLELVRARSAKLAGWISEPDAGIAEAFNKGLARARGDYISFLNADDALASPGAISGLIEGARERGWPMILHGDCDLIERDSGAFLYRFVYHYSRRRFLRFVIPPHPGMLVHRKFFERYGRFDTSFRISMDYELQLRGFPEFHAVRVPVVAARVRTGGMSTLDPMQGVEENLRALRMNGHLRSPLHEAGIRAYYRLRFAARGLLEALGIYRQFVALRQRLSRRRAGL